MMTRQSQIDLEVINEKPLLKVISGGQTGVDQAALRAAKDVGLPTGGYAPKGYKTEVGLSYWLKEAYGIVETDVEHYWYRTLKNIKSSDATLILIYDQDSPGTKQTIRYCKTLKKPYKLIDLNVAFVEVYEVLEWLALHNVKTLNVAGNRASKHPNISKVSYNILYSIFLEIRNRG